MLLLLLSCVPPDEQLDSSAPSESSESDADADADADSDTDADSDADSDADADADSDTDTDPESVPDLEPVVVWAVRHAEKSDEGDDPSLTEEGAERAQALVAVMEEVPLTAVYATEKARTQETCQPTAEAHGLEVQTEIDPEDELAAFVMEWHRGEAVLHCGHSYTLPDFFEAIGADDAEGVSGYGQVWIITADDEEVLVEMGHYGE